MIIALLAGQTVEMLDWAHRVAVANKFMTDEISLDDGPEIYQRAAMDGCLTGRLDAIEHGLEARADRKPMLTLIKTYQVEPLSYDTQPRDAVNNTGVAVHIPERQYSGWSLVYGEIPTMDRTGNQEQRDLGQLYALRAVGGPLSDGEQDRILIAAEALRADEDVMFGAAKSTLPRIFQTGLKLDQARVADFMGWARAHYQHCLSDVPADWDGHRALTPESPG